MTIRTERTLRHAWEQSFKLATESNRLADTAKNAAADAEAAETAAAAHRKTEQNARSVSDAMMAEALDLVDYVNHERADLGLSALKPGDAYPPDPGEQPSAGQPVQGLQGLQPLGPLATRTDGEVAK